MVVSGAVIQPYDAEPLVLAIWERPVELETLPLLVWLFPDTPEAAEREVRESDHVTLCWYARDDEMTFFHGRPGRAIYTFQRTAVEAMTLQQFQRLKAGADQKLGRHMTRD